MSIVLYSASYTLIWIIFFCFGSAQLWTAHFNAVVKYGVRVLCMRASKNRFCEVLRNQGPLTGVSAREIKGMLMARTDYVITLVKLHPLAVAAVNNCRCTIDIIDYVVYNIYGCTNYIGVGEA